jgi:hypothetical protein
MHQSVRAAAVAAMVAIGSPMLTEAADAQTIGWNLIRPVACETYEFTSADPNRPVTNLIIWTSTFTIYANDSPNISALLKFCYDGSAFYGYYNGSSTWSEFYVVPGLK